MREEAGLEGTVEEGRPEEERNREEVKGLSDRSKSKVCCQGKKRFQGKISKVSNVLLKSQRRRLEEGNLSLGVF